MIKAYIPYYKRLMSLAIPLVLTQAGQMVVHLVDNAMVGRVGTEELAAASFANSIFMVIMMVGMGLIFGITPILGHAIGAKNNQLAAGIMKNGSLVALLITVILFLLSWSIIWFMPYMGQNTEVLLLAIPYYKTLCLSLIPFLGFMLLKQIGEGLGNTFLAMVATISTNVINILLNYILIFGKLGFAEMGLLGAGVATLIARFLMPIILFFGFILVRRYKWYLQQMLKAQISKKVLKDVFRTGYPIAVQMLLEVSIFAIGAIMMGWISDVALAAHQVALGLAGFTFMIANGVAMATTIRVSVQLGNKNVAGLKMASFASIHLVLVYMLLTATGFLLLRYQLPKIFTEDVAVIQQAAILLVVAGIFQIFDGLQVISLGILRGISDVKIPMYIAAFSYLLIGLPVSYFSAFVLNFGPVGIWFGFVAGLGLTGVLLAFRIKFMWKNIQIVP